MLPQATTPLPAIIVAVCTYRRNVELNRLLEGLVEAANRAADSCAVGVAVVDDSADRCAEVIAKSFLGRFELGVHYRVSGKQNISLARNIGLEVGRQLGDWIAMTDDDCVPDPRWIAELLSVQRITGASCVSGRYVRRAPPGSPAWLVEQPFLNEAVGVFEDLSETSIAATHNSMVSVRWLAEHPRHRFDPNLGRLGGEDMVFFRDAHQLGLVIRYAYHAVIFEEQPPERCTYRYQLKYAWWHGNTRYVTMVRSGSSSRLRMVIHGIGDLQRSVCRPVVRILRREPPEFRFALTSLVRGLGIVSGAFGLRVKHH